MLQEEFFKKVVSELNSLGMDYMITGSMASNYYGHPRLTHDIDFVLVLPGASVKKLTKRFSGPRYYLSEAAAVEAVKKYGMFNLIDSETGLKADFWILDRSDDYRVAAFERRRKAFILGQEASIASAEDVVLSKLDWFKRSGESSQHLKDAKAVAKVQKEYLNASYLKKWAKYLGLDDLLKKVL